VLSQKRVVRQENAMSVRHMHILLLSSPPWFSWGQNFITSACGSRARTYSFSRTCMSKIKLPAEASAFYFSICDARRTTLCFNHTHTFPRHRAPCYLHFYALPFMAFRRKNACLRKKSKINRHVQKSCRDACHYVCMLMMCNRRLRRCNFKAH